MKKIVNGIIVVEGTNDISFLSSYIDAEYVELNGLELRNIKYLKAVSKEKTIYLLTDPDEEGLRIREKVKKQIPSAVDIEIDIKECTKNVKNGIAEANIEEIYRVFSKIFAEKKENTKISLYRDVFNKIQISKDKKLLRNKICDSLGIEYCNQKTFEKRIMSLEIDIEELNKIIKEQNRGN